MQLSPLCLALAAVFVGCATLSKGPHEVDVAAKEFRPPVGTARVYVYCQRTGGTIALDGGHVGRVEPGWYIFKDLAPGPHTVSAVMTVYPYRAANDLQVDATSDAVYFVRYWRPWTPFSRPRLALVSEADGRKAVLASKLASAP